MQMLYCRFVAYSALTLFEMTTVFLLPDELEFVDRGFGLSSLHAPSDCIFSFVRSYADGSELVLTFEVGSATALRASLMNQGQILSDVVADCLTGVSFQSWHGERTIRCAFSARSLEIDLRIHFDPVASLHFSALS
jgi:hypothetical protein